MTLRVDVVFDPDVDQRPKPGSRVVVELRDTAQADAPSITVESAETVVAPDSSFATVEFATPAPGLTVWAHVAVDGDRLVKVGDMVTMASFPVPSTEQEPGRIAVTVRQVR